MNDTSNTALVTLKCHIQDAKKDDSILKDRSSLKAFEYLNTLLDSKGKEILNKKVRSNLERHTALRAKKYDDYVLQFLQKHPEAVIVNTGCGLDNRFERIDNGKCTLLDLDFTDIIDIKKQIFPTTERYLQIAQSVFDFSWMDHVWNKPLLLLAEGVFMYCEETDVKSLFDEIHNKFPGTEIIFEVFSSK